MRLGNYVNMSLHSRLLLYFAMFAIIPILLVGVASYAISVKVTTERAIQYSNQMISQIATKVDDIILDTYKISNMIAEDPSIQEVLRKPLHSDIARRYSVDLEIDTRLNYIATFKDELFGFYVIGENGGKYKSNYTSTKNKDLRNTDWYTEILTSSKPVWFGTHEGSFAAETSGQSLISQGYAIKDKATGKVSGVVLVDIEESLLSNLVNSQLGQSGYMFILDKNNNVISHPDRSLISQKIHIDDKDHKRLSEYGTCYYIDNYGEKSIIVYKTLPLNSWKIVASIPLAELTKDSKKIGTVIAAILSIVVILALIGAWNISGSVTRPIRKMMLLMRKVEEGDLSVVMEADREDEIGQLSESFNIMIQKLRNLMSTVYQEQKELRKAELKALQSQINPHFLYNTLDSIIWMARANRNDDIVKIVTAITKLFRISISRGKDIISISEEIEHIKSYLIIQHIRYSNKFTYEVMIPESLYKFKILKLILQPIVENALYHGVKMKRQQGHISITGREEKEYIILEIKDTGIGIKKEELQALNDMFNNNSGEKKLESYGLRNVNERIKIFFGCQYGLTIDSKYGIGTKVQVKIPKSLEGE